MRFVEAGPPKQIAVPIPRVSVGVTKILRKFEAEEVQSTPQAQILVEAVDCPTKTDGIWLIASHHAVATLVELQGKDAFSDRGVTGQINGIVTQYGETPISIRVRAEKIGRPWFIEGVLPIGVQRTDIAFPGAKGAQLIGEDKHPPPPNQHESPSARFFIANSISDSACGLNQIVIFPFKLLVAVTRLFVLAVWEPNDL